MLNNLHVNVVYDTSPGLYIRAGSQRCRPASLPGFDSYFHCFTSLNMLRRWTHNRLLFTKLQLLKNLKKKLHLLDDILMLIDWEPFSLRCVVQYNFYWLTVILSFCLILGRLLIKCVMHTHHPKRPFLREIRFIQAIFCAFFLTEQLSNPMHASHDQYDSDFKLHKCQ